MVSSSSNLVDNIAAEIDKIKSKHGNDDKKYKTYRIKYKDYECFLEYINVKDDLILYTCLCYNRNYQNKFNENLNKRFANTYKFCNQDINKLILLLQKHVFPCEYMDDWKKFNKTSLPKDFYSHLNMEYITDEYYTDTKRICKDFEVKYLGDYHDGV